MILYVIKLVLLLIIIGILSLTIIYSLLCGKKSALIYSFTCYNGSLFIYCYWSLLKFYKDIDKNLFIYIIQHIPRSFTAAAFLIFCLIFSSRNGKIKRSHLIILLAEPVIFYVLIVTNDFHNLIYYYDSGGYSIEKLLYHIHSFILTLYLIVGAIILFRFCIRMFGIRTRQSAFLILGSAIIMSFNCIIITIDLISPKLLPNLLVWLTGFFNILISSIFFSIVTLKYRFLNIVTAFSKMVDSMRECILFVDSFNRIIYYNSSFTKTFSWTNQVWENVDAAVLVENIKQRLINYDESEEVFNAIIDGTEYNVSGEMVIDNDRLIYFSVNVEPIFNGTKKPVGRMISFSDITEYKKLMAELSEKNEEITNMNKELTSMNAQLREHSLMVEELAITKERNRYARDAHDTIGHTMTKLITILEVCHMTCQKDPQATAKKLEEALNISRMGINEIRRSIAGLIPEKLEVNSLKNALKCLVSDFLATGVNIDFSIDGHEKNISPSCSNTIFRACQEALTNSLRHGKAKNVTIILRFSENNVTLFILDDGIGCKDIKEGMGLEGMKQRVQSLNGTISYGSDGYKGFNIVIDIPLEVSIND